MNNMKRALAIIGAATVVFLAYCSGGYVAARNIQYTCENVGTKTFINGTQYVCLTETMANDVYERLQLLNTLLKQGRRSQDAT